MTLRLAEIRDLAYRFVPGKAADERLYSEGASSWWPAHEIGHFLVATPDECRRSMFGIDVDAEFESPTFCYVVSREVAAISISQRILRRSGNASLADYEISYTDTDTIGCSFEPWCKRAVLKLKREHRVVRLPATFDGMEALLMRKAQDVGTKFYSSARAANAARGQTVTRATDTKAIP